jgi:hypothetical protein
VSWRLCGRARQETPGNGLGQESIVEEGPRELRMEFCSALRRRETEHAERRAGCGLESGVSCGRSEQRWRPKLDLCSRKPFDDHHRSTTLGTTPKTVRVSGILICLRLLYLAKQVKA